MMDDRDSKSLQYLRNGNIDDIAIQVYWEQFLQCSAQEVPVLVGCIDT